MNTSFRFSPRGKSPRILQITLNASFVGFAGTIKFETRHKRFRPFPVEEENISWNKETYCSNSNVCRTKIG